MAGPDLMDKLETLETMAVLVMWADLANQDLAVDQETKDHLDSLAAQDNLDHPEFNDLENDLHLDHLDSLAALDKVEIEVHLDELVTTAALVALDSLDLLDHPADPVLLDNLVALEKVETLEVLDAATTARHHVWLQDIRNINAGQALLIVLVAVR